MVCVGRLAVVCVCWLGVWLAGASSRSIPTMDNSLNNLLKHYKIPDGFNGTPVFSRDFLSEDLLQDSDRRVLMGGVLLVYKKLIGRMLEQVTNSSAPPGPRGPPVPPRQTKVQEHLRHLLEMVENLMTHHYQEQTKLLQNLWDVQIDNSSIQSKSLMQFDQLYRQASSLIRREEEKKMRRRRRRQTARTKTRLSS